MVVNTCKVIFIQIYVILINDYSQKVPRVQKEEDMEIFTLNNKNNNLIQTYQLHQQIWMISILSCRK